MCLPFLVICFHIYSISVRRASAEIVEVFFQTDKIIHLIFSDVYWECMYITVRKIQISVGIDIDESIEII